MEIAWNTTCDNDTYVRGTIEGATWESFDARYYDGVDEWHPLFIAFWES